MNKLIKVFFLLFIDAILFYISYYICTNYNLLIGLFTSGLVLIVSIYLCLKFLESEKDDTPFDEDDIWN